MSAIEIDNVKFYGKKSEMVVGWYEDANRNALVFDDLLHQGVSDQNAIGWGYERTKRASHSIATTMHFADGNERQGSGENSQDTLLFISGQTYQLTGLEITLAAVFVN
jgi:hypothetical protein